MHLEDQTARVLCIDDDQAVRDFLRIQLSKVGYDVVVAADGEEGLGVLTRERPDIVLVDTEMPRLDGFRFTVLLKQNPDTRDIPIVVLSGPEEQERRVKLLDAGVDYILPKPIHSEELIAVIRSHMRMFRLYRTLLETNEDLQNSYDLACDAEARYRSLVNEALDAIFIVDSESGAIREGNLAAAALAGISQDDLGGRDFNDLCPAAKSVSPAEMVEAEFVRGDETVPIRIKLSRVRSISSDLLQYVVRDMSPIRDMIERRIEAERVAAILETSVTMSEKLNTPLSVIINSAEALRKSQHGGESKVFTRIDYIFKAVKQIREVIEMLARVQRASSKEYLPGTKMLDLEEAVVDSKKG